MTFNESQSFPLIAQQSQSGGKLLRSGSHFKPMIDGTNQLQIVLLIKTLVMKKTCILEKYYSILENITVFMKNTIFSAYNR